MPKGIYYRSPELRKKIGDIWRGKHLSTETINKISQNKERAKKISERLKGIPKSEEHKRKLSECRKGRTYEEIFGAEKAKIQRLKRSLGNRGIIKSEEEKEEIKKRMKGKRYALGVKRTDEQKKRYSLSKLGEKNPMYGMSKEKCPAWSNGKSFEPYTPEFTDRFKSEIRKRDNQICMNCGIHREKLNRALYIHHINYDKEMTIPENCISLCLHCHALTNFNREYWIKLFQEKMSKTYGYKYSESGKIILEINNNNLER